MDYNFFDPLSEYTQSLKDKLVENATAHFEDLVRRSAIDVEENRRTAKEYRTEKLAAEKLAKSYGKLRALKIVLIVLAVVAGIAALVSVFMFANGTIELGLFLGLLIGGIVVAVAVVLVVVLVLSPKMKNIASEKAAHELKAAKALAAARLQMAPLNALFDSDDTRKLVEKTAPILKLDKTPSLRRVDFFGGRFGLEENCPNMDKSVVDALSGEIVGNPFLFKRVLSHRLGSQTYSGSLVISWTTTTTDSEGHTQTVAHTQTLVATVVKPKPFYNMDTTLVYGNEAAPDLTFGHEPTHAHSMSDKKVQRKVKSGYKQMQKRARNATAKGNASFTEMSNADFEVLFNGDDRNNEVQFRLLFTPLAQKNMLALMKDKQYYGDDFYFYKRGKLNYVRSEHGRSWNMDTSGKRYASYDVDIARKNFLEINQAYFQSMYFDFAPLLAIPLYQEHNSAPYNYKTYDRNYSDYEYEMAINALDVSALAHERTNSDVILKASFVEKDGQTDIVEVEAFSYLTVPRVDVVPKFGGDGCMHGVPVHWVEYIPVSKKTLVAIKRLDLSDRDYKAAMGGAGNAVAGRLDNCSYFHGLLVGIVTADGQIDENINKILKS